VADLGGVCTVCSTRYVQSSEFLVVPQRVRFSVLQDKVFTLDF